MGRNRDASTVAEEAQSLVLFLIFLEIFTAYVFLGNGFAGDLTFLDLRESSTSLVVDTILDMDFEEDFKN
jgi:hypothetical protein